MKILKVFFSIFLLTYFPVTAQTIKIGNQEWMSENLNVSHFRNGDPIPEAKTNEEWRIAGEQGKPAWCYYENKTENGKIYGKLYNWYAVSDPRGLAPEGWHIPSFEEWTELTKVLGGRNQAGGKLKALANWKNPNKGATNEFNFNALPGGTRKFIPSSVTFTGDFVGLNAQGDWWTTTISTGLKNSANFQQITYDAGFVYTNETNFGSGKSVRCIKD